jgi:hypothetical protein
MKRLIILFAVLTIRSIGLAAGQTDLDAMYQQLDQAIEQLDDCLA